jgi:hypothetical protein
MSAWSNSREVMHELAALVEEGRVVLVGLDDEEARTARPRGGTELGRHAADEEAGREPRMLEDPRQHRRDGRLAVRAGHRQNPSPPQQVLADPLRARTEASPRLEDRLHERVAAADDVPDHVQVRRERELVGAVALDQLDAGRSQQVAHRWIHIGVAAGDAMAGGGRQLRDTPHEGAADAQDMKMQDRFRTAQRARV